MKQGNTRLARLLLRIAGITTALMLFPVCCEAAAFNSDIWLVMLFPLGFGLLSLFYASSQGLWFEMGKERTWRAVCGGVGFTGVARSYRFGLIGAFVLGDTKTIYPKLRDVHGTHKGWTGIVTPFAGQTVEDYTKQADAFKLAFHVPFVTFGIAKNGLISVRAGKVPVPDAYDHPARSKVQRVRDNKDDSLYQEYREVTLRRRARSNSTSARRRGNTPPRQTSTSDKKAQAVPSIPKVYAHTQVVPDLTAELELLKGVPVARDLNGRGYCISIEEQHWLIAGRSGSGKNSWIWALVCGLAPAWRARLVRYWAADPKHIELAIEPGWWYRYADSDEDIVSMLEACVSDMIARARLLQGKARKFTPSIVTPLNVIVIDELGYLVAYMTDRKLRERAVNAISSLLVMGRANGYAVVGAVQDPRKETVGFRDQFQIRIALGLPEQMVDLVLGEGMHDAGALCEQIPLGPAGQGTGYAISETSLKPVCLRPAWYSDEAIRAALIGG